MPEEPTPIGEPVEEALLKILRPDLLAMYRQENDRHKQEKQAIEDARRRARSMIWRCFRKPLRTTKYDALEAEYLERVQGEADRHARFMAELREMIGDHRTAE